MHACLVSPENQSHLGGILHGGSENGAVSNQVSNSCLPVSNGLEKITGKHGCSSSKGHYLQLPYNQQHSTIAWPSAQPDGPHGGSGSHLWRQRRGGLLGGPALRPVPATGQHEGRNFLSPPLRSALTLMPCISIKAHLFTRAAVGVFVDMGV